MLLHTYKNAQTETRVTVHELYKDNDWYYRIMIVNKDGIKQGACDLTCCEREALEFAENTARDH